MPVPIVIKFMKAGVYPFISNTVTDPDERLTYNYVSIFFFCFLKQRLIYPRLASIL